LVCFPLPAFSLGDQATVDAKVRRISGEFAWENDFNSFSIGDLKHHRAERGGVKF
jgi:hypothetical protein